MWLASPAVRSSCAAFHPSVLERLIFKWEVLFPEGKTVNRPGKLMKSSKLLWCPRIFLHAQGSTAITYTLEEENTMQCRQLARGLTGILNPVAFSIVSCFSADFSFHGTRRACVMQHPCRRKACLMSMCVSPVRRLGSSIAGAAKKRNVFVKLCSASCRRDYYLPGDWRCKVIMLFQFFSVFFITTCSGNFAAAQWTGTGDARAMLKGSVLNLTIWACAGSGNLGRRPPPSG